MYVSLFSLPCLFFFSYDYRTTKKYQFLFLVSSGFSFFVFSSSLFLLPVIVTVMGVCPSSRQQQQMKVVVVVGGGGDVGGGVVLVCSTFQYLQSARQSRIRLLRYDIREPAPI